MQEVPSSDCAGTEVMNDSIWFCAQSILILAVALVRLLTEGAP